VYTVGQALELQPPSPAWLRVTKRKPRRPAIFSLMMSMLKINECATSDSLATIRLE
jgi:hypothetical protein